jgi:hypothetical protein
MASTVLETRAIIAAEDRASATFAAIQKRVDALSKSTIALGKVFSQVNSMGANMTGATAAVTRAGTAVAEMSRAMSAGVSSINAAMASISREAASASRAVANSARVAQPRTLASPGSSPQHGRGYAGGVSVGMGNGMRAGFGFGGSGLLGTIKDLAVSSAVIHVAHGSFEGLKEMNSLRQSAIQQGMTPEQIARATDVANRISQKYKSTSTASNFETFLETGAISHDEDVRENVTELFGRRAQLGFNAGRSESEVRGGQMQFMKAMDTLGMFTPDEKTGKIDTDRMRKYFEASMGVQAVEKGNLTDAMVLQTAKYLKATGMAITPEGWKRQLFYAAEAGSSGANEANRMMTTFSGTAKKDTIPQLIADGFMEADGRRTGKKGKPGAYYGLRVANEDAANADPRAWAVDHVVAAMKKHGLDANDKNEVVKYVRSLQTNQQTANYLIKAVTQRAEADRQLEQANRVKVDEATAIKGQAGSINAALEAIESRVKDIGSAGDDRGGNFIAQGLNHVGERLDSLNQFIRNPNAKTGADLGQTAGEIAAIVIGKIGLDKVLDKGGLGGAGAALTGSAGELSVAAKALDAAAGRLGAGSPLPKGVPPVAPVVAAPLAAGAIPAAAIGGAVIVGIAGSAAYAGHVLDTEHGKEPGHRPWTPGRLWRNFTGGGDDMPSADEIDASATGGFSGGYHFDVERRRAMRRPDSSIVDALGLPGGGKISAVVEGPIPVTGTGEVTLTVKLEMPPELRASIDAARKIQLKLATPTGHSPGALGPSMPEAHPDANHR